MNWLKRLIYCYRGHRWGKPRDRLQNENFAGMVTRVKDCRRCGAVVPVKPRKRA